jgi:hypothetical protein
MTIRLFGCPFRGASDRAATSCSPPGSHATSRPFKFHDGRGILIVRAIGRRQRFRDETPVHCGGHRIGAENPAAVAERAAVADFEPVVINFSLTQSARRGVDAPEVGAFRHFPHLEGLALDVRGRVSSRELADHQPRCDFGKARPPENECLFSELEDMGMQGRNDPSITISV